MVATTEGLSLADVGSLLKVSDHAVCALLEAGELAGVGTGAEARVSRASLDAYLERTTGRGLSSTLFDRWRDVATSMPDVSEEQAEEAAAEAVAWARLHR